MDSIIANIRSGSFIGNSDILARHEVTHRYNEQIHDGHVRSRACLECAKARERCSKGEPCVRCSTRRIQCKYPEGTTLRRPSGSQPLLHSSAISRSHARPIIDTRLNSYHRGSLEATQMHSTEVYTSSTISGAEQSDVNVGSLTTVSGPFIQSQHYQQSGISSPLGSQPRYSLSTTGIQCPEPSNLRGPTGRYPASFLTPTHSSTYTIPHDSEATSNSPYCSSQIIEYESHAQISYGLIPQQSESLGYHSLAPYDDVPSQSDISHNVGYSSMPPPSSRVQNYEHETHEELSFGNGGGA